MTQCMCRVSDSQGDFTRLVRIDGDMYHGFSSLVTCTVGMVLQLPWWLVSATRNNDWITVVIYSNRKLFISPVHDHVPAHTIRCWLGHEYNGPTTISQHDTSLCGMRFPYRQHCVVRDGEWSPLKRFREIFIIPNIPWVLQSYVTDDE